ncbi:MAG TPA: DciA family protein [Phycisphaerae bacterium]|nr:DciA family protein [Phycisphaerae bacterium]
MLSNRAGRAPRALLAAEEAARWVRGAAEQVRGCAEVERAWRSVAAQWSTSTAVVNLSDGVLTVAAADRAVAEEVRRRSARLVTELRARTSRVRSIRVAVVGAERDAEARRSADGWR